MIDILKRILDNELLNKFGIYFIGKAVIGGINFILVPIYSNALAPEEFGIIVLIMIFVQVSKAIIKLGLETAFSIKFYKYNHKQKICSLYGTYVVYLLFIIIFFTVTFINNNWIHIILNVELTYLETLKIVGIISLSIFVDFFFNLLKMEQNASKFILNTVMFTLCKVVLLIYFIVFLNQGYVSYLNANILSYLLFFIISYFYIISNYEVKYFIFDTNIMKNLVKIGLPVIPGIIFSMALASGDQYILRHMGFLTLVGVYAMGYKFAEAFSNFLIIPFKQALVPIAMKKGNNDIAEYKQFLSKVAKNFISALLLCIIILYSFLNQLYRLIIKEDYIEGFNIIWIIILALIIWGLANILSNTLILKEQTYKTVQLSMLATGLNIVLNILWIPKYNIYGAAYATLISYFVILLLYYTFSQKIIKVNYNFKKILLSVLIFIISFSIQNFIDTLMYNDLSLIIMKITIVLVTINLYHKFNILDMYMLRGEKYAKN